jgi:hypothetical protein
LSADAGLSSVAGQPISAGNETGTSADPIMASISVASGQADIDTSDIETTVGENATWNIYSDRGFSQDKDVSISLPAGGGTVHVYVKVMAEDGVTELYYDVTVTVPDTLPPVPGSGVAADAASITQTTLTLDWAVAADNVTAEADLKYYVYHSMSDNISSVADCTANGTLLNSGGTDNIATYAVTGLTPDTAYYFNVVVEDEAGNQAVYTASPATTKAPDVPSGGGGDANGGGNTPSGGGDVSNGGGTSGGGIGDGAGSGDNSGKKPARTSAKAKVKFDANGGKIGKAKAKVVTARTGKAIGKLPAPKRAKHRFAGWYMKKNGGAKVTAKTKIKKSTILYAHWKKMQKYGKVVNTGAVYVRSEPNLSPAIGRMKAGDTFKIRGYIKLEGKNNSWYILKWKDQKAYIHAKYVKVVYK